jgi:hypothetical protein
MRLNSCLITGAFRVALVNAPPTPPTRKCGENRGAFIKVNLFDPDRYSFTPMLENAIIQITW